MSPALRQLQLPFDVPPRTEIAGRLRQLQLAGGILSYHLVRAKRRTIALFVDGDGIEARAPRHVAIADIEAFIREKERWIRKRLAEPRRRPLVWETGARLPWLGRTVTLALRHGEIGVWLSEDRLELGLADGASLRERALDWMRTQALEVFRERIAELVRFRGLRVLAVGLSNARTRWGSCGSNGRILLYRRAAVSGLPGGAARIERPRTDPARSIRKASMRILHTMLRVADLERSLRFYTEVLGMRLLRRKDYPEGKFTLTFVGYGDETDTAVIELTHNWGVDKYELGNAFGHIAVAVDDAYKACEEVKRRGGKVTREAGPMKHGTTVIAFIEDPDSYKIELIERK